MKKLFKIISIVFICLMIFFLSLYFIATSSFFIKNVVLPVTGKIFDAEISVEKIIIAPFTGDLEIQNLNVTSTDGYSIKLRNYNSNINLFSIYKGIIKINHLKLGDTYINITQELSFDKKDNKPLEKKKNYYRLKFDEISDFFKLDITNIKIENLNVSYTIKRGTIKESSLIELSNFNATVPQLKTGIEGFVDFKGLIKAGPVDGKNKLTGELSGKVITKINEDSLPSLIKVSSQAKFGDQITFIGINFTSDKNKKMKTYSFTVNINVKDFLLLPFFKTFVEGDYSDASGIIKDLALDVTGTDLINPDIYTNVDSSFNTTIKELTIPTALAKYGPIRIVFLPVEILSNMNQYTSTKAIPSDLKTIFKYANSVTNGVNNMHFELSKIATTLKEGMVKIEKLEMIGGTLSPIRSISIKGDIDLSNQMNIDTKTSFAGVIIPLQIEGTVTNPKPNLNMLLPGMVYGTASNIVDTGIGVGSSITKGGIDIGKQMSSYLLNTTVDSSKK